MKIKGRLISLVLSIAVLLCSFSVVANAETTTVIGDADGNGELTTEDARLVLRMAACIDEPDIAIADIDGDGYVTTDDVVLVLRTVADLESGSDSGNSSGSVTIPDKNGDNMLSDDPENEFIKLISSTYGVDTDALVAIYSVPDTGTNYVLQFKKSIIGSTYKKSPSNLKRVYHIGVAPQREISYTEGLSNNYNCTAAEGLLTFNLVKGTVMEQYPDYFEDV